MESKFSAQCRAGAEDGNRTRVSGMEIRGSAIELPPQPERATSRGLQPVSATYDWSVSTSTA